MDVQNIIGVILLTSSIIFTVIYISGISKSIKVLKERVKRLEYSDGFLRERERAAYEQIRELNRKIKGIPVRDTASIKVVKEILDRLHYLAKDVEVKVKQRERIAELEKSNALLNERNKNQFEMIRAYQLKEKGEIIGAELVEPFVQEGGEIEGFNSQAIREGKSHKIPNPDEVFEMLAEIEDKEPKIDKPLIDCEFVTYETERKVRHQCPNCKGLGRAESQFMLGYGADECLMCKGEGYI